jgi:hypothetical protein
VWKVPVAIKDRIGDVVARGKKEIKACSWEPVLSFEFYAGRGSLQGISLAPRYHAFVVCNSLFCSLFVLR